MSERANPDLPATTAPTAPAAATAVATAVRPTAPRSGGRRIFLINGLGLLVLILIALGIFYIWHQGYYFYSTDDAQISGTIATVASVQPGTITGVYHELGATVSANNTIVTLRGANGQTLRAVSPINGTIINEGATPGEVIGAGQPIAQVVDLSKLYVTAYVEENHIGDVHPGQGVDVTVDAVSNTTFHGTVGQILPATASTFSALPTTDYASGNFTKVTQRVPVVVALDAYTNSDLRPGESASVTIHLHQ